MRTSFLLFIAGLCGTGLANATIIAVLNSGPTPTAGGFSFSYNADLSSDEQMNPAATNGISCPGPSNTSVQCNPAGTFFTLYNIPGYVSASATAPGWVVDGSAKTPSTINAPSGSGTSVTFEYSGPIVNGPATVTGFTVVSTANGVNHNGTFTSQSTSIAESSDGRTEQLIGAVSIPESTVPEPGSMALALIGGGLIGIATLRRRKVQR